MLACTVRMILRGQVSYVNWDMATLISLQEEAPLWESLRKFAGGSADFDIPDLRGWNPRLLYFPTEPVGHSLSPSLAKAITGFHYSLSRAYAFAAYGQAEGRVLKASDRDVLDLQILAVSGSRRVTRFHMP